MSIALLDSIMLEMKEADTYKKSVQLGLIVIFDR